MGGNARVYLRATRDPSGETSYYRPAWSPHGTDLAVDVLYEPPSDSESHESSELVVFRPSKPQLMPKCARCYSTGTASWSPDGRRLVFVGYEAFDPYAAGGLNVATLPTEQARLLTSESRFDGKPAWSPDGRLIAFVSQPALYVGRKPGPRRLHVISPAGGRARRLTDVEATNPSWSPDGKYLAFDDGRRVGTVGRSGGAVRFVATGTDPAWSPDGESIAIVRNGSVWLIDPAGRHARLAARNATSPTWRLAG